MPGADDASWRPAASVATLRRRADLVERTRRFFAARGVLEVDVPVLQGGANLDHGVVPYRVETELGPRFLPTSPEHPLKRLVCAGAGAVWTLAPAFRRGERGRRHQSEFRMLEWYRPGWDDATLRDEVVALLAELTGWPAECELLSYRDALTRHAGIDPFACGSRDVLRALANDAAAVADDPRAALDLLLATKVEPHLGRGRWTALVDYPPWAAAQSRLRRDARDTAVAARFEVYRDGVELANGYHELADAGELGDRLGEELAARGDAGVVRDARFEAAVAHGLGDCAGVAVGFDRVVMLALGLGSVAETQAFPSDRA
jgi:lysyl-tRNA synthetase class 2